MTISGDTTTRLVQSAMDAQKTRADIGIAVLDKANDVARQQGEAMVQMIEQSVIAPTEGRLDAYA